MADYGLRPGFDGVFHRPTSAWIPRDTQARGWIDYLAWLAVPNVPDADTRTLAEARVQAKGVVRDECEAELAKYAPPAGGHPVSIWTAESIRREAVAADAEGTPWATGYPFLLEQVGIHGADVGAVATYWLGQWSTFEGNAKELERQREQALADIDAAGTIPDVDAVVAALAWQNYIEAQPAIVTLVAPAVTLDGPAALITLTPGATAVQIDVPSIALARTLLPQPVAAVLVAPAVTVVIA